MVKEKKQRRHPILLFVFAVVIPLIIVIALTIAVLSFAGVDAIGWMKDKGGTMPVVSSLITSIEEEESEKKLARANETIAMQKEELDDLTREITSLEDIIDQQEIDIKRLENRTIDEEENEENEGENNDEVKQASSSFRKMEPENAAQIIQNLDKNTAVSILSNLSGDVRGKILAEMESKNAAELTEEMLNQ